MNRDEPSGASWELYLRVCPPLTRADQAKWPSLDHLTAEGRTLGSVCRLSGDAKGGHMPPKFPGCDYIIEVWPVYLGRLAYQLVSHKVDGILIILNFIIYVTVIFLCLGWVVIPCDMSQCVFARDSQYCGVLEDEMGGLEVSGWLWSYLCWEVAY